MRPYSAFKHRTCTAVVLSVWLQAAFADVSRLLGYRNPCFLSGESHVCLPHTYIAGMPKAGTSALWLRLGNNTSFDLRPRKEYCPPANMSTLTDLLHWAASFPSPQQLASANTLLLSGCIGLHDAQRASLFFPLLTDYLNVTDFRVILLLRDYPQWLYAKYNYWCGPAYGDAQCSGQGRQRTEANARSPHHFAQLINQRGPQPHKDLTYPGYRRIVEHLQSLIGRERLLVLGQHQLYPDSRPVLQAVEQWVGVHPNTYEASSTQGVVNHSNNKGVRAVSHGIRPGEYQGLQPMLPETTATLQEEWQKDCLWLLQEYSICFKSCCAQQEQNAALASVVTL